MKKCHLDFETFSEADIRAVGAAKYSEHHSTEILCLVYQLEHETPVLWFPQLSDVPKGLLDIIKDETVLIVAHNAFFEYIVWHNVCVKRMGWPPISQNRFRCTAAKAAAFALPRGLEGAGKALNLSTTKDSEGKRVMMKLSRPRKPSKNNMATRWTSETAPDDFEALYMYCVTDVLSEKAIDEALPDLSDFEQMVWIIDQRINTRGVYIDRFLIDSAQYIYEQEKDRLNAELKEITNGEVEKGTSTAKLKAWVNAQGYSLENLQADTLRDFLKQEDILLVVRRAIKIRLSVGKVSVKKYAAFGRSMCADGRIRDTLMYHGANPGRWTAKLVQLQNIARGSLENPEQCIEVIKQKRLDLMHLLYNNTMEALSSCIRGAICAPKGKTLIVADYAAIEARVLAWVANDEPLLELFADNEPVYEHMAADIYGKDVEKVSKSERQLGKQAVLGCGFGMGPPKFLETCEKYDIDLESAATLEILTSSVKVRLEKLLRSIQTPVDKKKLPELLEQKTYLTGILQAETLEEALAYASDAGLLVAEFVVKKYRDTRAPIKKLWYAQEAAAIYAIENKGAKVKAGKITWFVQGDFLFCKLPSGRTNKYAYPRLREKETPWGEKRPSIHFMGVNSVTKKWCREHTYGGKLVENLVQGIARDLMAYAILRCEKMGYPIVFTVHDELIAEVGEGFGSVKEFETLMATLPAWAEGCPVEAHGWKGKRYRK